MTRELTEITVIDGDKKGIVVRVTTLLFEHGINTEDVDQTVRERLFRMTPHVDTSEMVCTEETLRRTLANLGADIGVVIGNHADLEPLTDRYDDRSTTWVTKRSRPTRTNPSTCWRSTMPT